MKRVLRIFRSELRGLWGDRPQVKRCRGGKSEGLAPRQNFASSEEPMGEFVVLSDLIRVFCEIRNVG